MDQVLTFTTGFIIGFTVTYGGFWTVRKVRKVKHDFVELSSNIRKLNDTFDSAKESFNTLTKTLAPTILSNFLMFNANKGKEIKDVFDWFAKIRDDTTGRSHWTTTGLQS